MTSISKNNMPYLLMGKGEPLVFIHGLGETKESWVNQFSFSNNFQLIIPELRGHGENKRLDHISITTFAKDVISLLDELEIEKAHICGISMGGAVAQEIYKLAPEKCKSLVLVSTFHYAPPFLSDLYLQYNGLSSIFLSPEKIKRRAIRKCLYNQSEENIELFLKHFYNPHPEGFKKSALSCLRINYSDLLPKIKIPTLIIGCEYDLILPISFQKSMHKLIPHSKLKIIKDSGHIAKLEKPKEFNQILRDFLDRV